MNAPQPTPTTGSNRRWLYLAIALLVIPVGLIARSVRGDADTSTVLGFVATYLGDTLWAVMFFFLIAACLPRHKMWTLAGLTLLITLGIEASQLYRGEPLATLRGFAPTRFLLGTHFLWSDVICLLVGSALAVVLYRLLPRPKIEMQA